MYLPLKIDNYPFQINVYISCDFEDFFFSEKALRILHIRKGYQSFHRYRHVYFFCVSVKIPDRQKQLYRYYIKIAHCILIHFRLFYVRQLDAVSDLFFVKMSTNKSNTYSLFPVKIMICSVMHKLSNKKQISTYYTYTHIYTFRRRFI